MEAKEFLLTQPEVEKFRCVLSGVYMLFGEHIMMRELTAYAALAHAFAVCLPLHYCAAGGRTRTSRPTRSRRRSRTRRRGGARWRSGRRRRERRVVRRGVRRGLLLAPLRALSPCPCPCRRTRRSSSGLMQCWQWAMYCACCACTYTHHCNWCVRNVTHRDHAIT